MTIAIQLDRLFTTSGAAQTLILLHKVLSCKSLFFFLNIKNSLNARYPWAWLWRRDGLMC